MFSIYYQKLLMYAVLPFIITVISYTFWFIFAAIKRDISLITNRAISTLVILLFMVHPNIV